MVNIKENKIEEKKVLEIYEEHKIDFFELELSHALVSTIKKLNKDIREYFQPELYIESIEIQKSRQHGCNKIIVEIIY